MISGKANSIAAQLVQSEESGKFRVLVTVAKDNWLDVQFVLNADQADELARELLHMAREARGRSIIIPASGLA